ncbi:hypothetical protein CWO85_00505 [Candidatus Phytoplasma ziziphi]|uniref:Uncharacterized protein n=1 Tax=Ziziphus jujuba witches'-broom phytoplasma TaxID=135727 RepID=A0A660HNC2_ZIZJU|nr:hypothetical protein CWO85_00505 [Candidatus Phytoplasma ziziphi]
MDLRWLGNGSPHMYCFWKTPEVDLLQHNDILKAEHAKNNENLGIYLIWKIPGLKKITTKNIMKKIAKKVSSKAIKDLSVGNFIITGFSELTSEKLTDRVGDILEQNPDALEVASTIISKLENFIMGCTDVVDDIPGVNNLAKGGLEGWKTVGKAKSYPANFLEGIIKGDKNQDYKEVENPLDLAENLAKGATGAVEGVAKGDCKYN